ncbi:homoserine kinase [Gluconobacter kanchanaburiensis]|uniref:Homoserine kinase n=1 Tax=Gluconobacter kanchanaburiensis NBRC 103587 TaxID=1307948 RepID=A0A511BB61_9PROT|nr:homoserine kinase [Gluconobacter kanchanaburiensis]MBF0862712.1 homoserine kinase [Gluconobacter kanchanaburiensis]GBR69249.1 homoserine kinase [Gluconobacter kanchanaburiensis NBRC 103587]GEK97031.1 homoserine kinase [Gluconobacter kanchanaburiensis NBRC 103587]
MAVYTELAAETLEAFLGTYGIGLLVSFHGIAEGVENSNFLLRTTEGDFILTLFERRVNASELPWFLGLMQHLAGRGLNCPLPVSDRTGTALRTLAGRPAAITTFLPGVSATQLDEGLCLELGKSLARLHLAGDGYGAVRPNALSPAAWAPLLESCGESADALSPGLTAEVRSALRKIEEAWPSVEALPRGQIHADLFPDNVFFQNGQVSGLIDFYFACTDFLAYDLAICLNAWCFRDEKTFEPSFAAAILQGYESVRPLTKAEKSALPLLCQGAAIRFLLTRLYDWINTPANALVTRKDPLAYLVRLRHFAGAAHV